MPDRPNYPAPLTIEAIHAATAEILKFENAYAITPTMTGQAMYSMPVGALSAIVALARDGLLVALRRDGSTHAG